MRAGIFNALIATAVFCSCPVGAEEAATKATVLPAAADPTVRSLWSGLYIGLHAGVGGGREKYPIFGSYDTGGTLADLGGDVHMDASGGLLGAQIGYNFVLPNRVLLGVEVDFSRSSVKDRLSFDATANGASESESIGSTLDYFGTLRGRLGYVVTDPWLVYATAGLAFGAVNSGYSADYAVSGGPGTSVGVGKANYLTGWAAGIGTAYAITPNLSFRTEYLHADLGTGDLLGYDVPPIAAGLKIHPVYDFVRAGFDYRFEATAPATTLDQASYVAPTQFSWTGFHVGANAGYVAAQDRYPIDYLVSSTPLAAEAKLHGAGTLFGLQAGYDYEFANRTVLGLEADLSWANVPGKLGAGLDLSSGGLSESVSASVGTSLQYLGTVRVRAGFAVTEPWLVYATAGWAY
ncbi:MAG: outer membrane beta-barrel protein, partial [Ancalomicrobiaceae bacterium]|nr:outer membrane beta-barrel protein [Ancalomicrobiaceae bacterium]